MWIQVDECVFEALGLLGLGKGVRASMYFDIHSDVANLEKVHWELAKRFKELHNELDDAIVKIGAVSHTEMYRELVNQTIFSSVSSSTCTSPSRSSSRL